MESQIQMKTNELWDSAENLEQIRQLFAPTLTALEFQFFIGLGKATGLNPFAKELWCVKYGSGPAQVFIGRDGYRRAALSHPDYDYHQCDTVYQNDSFEVSNGEIRHTYNLKDRGQLVGAYCVTKRIRASKSVYVFVKFSEYNTGKSLWASKPDVMCKKVAESHGLRAAFQDLLGGTYTPEEMSDEVVQRPVAQKDWSDEIHNKVPASEGLQMELMALLESKGVSKERIDKALAYYCADSLTELSESKCLDFIAKLGG